VKLISSKIPSSFATHRWQIIIIAALAILLLVLIILPHPDKAQPQLSETPPTHKKKSTAVNKDFPYLTLDYMRGFTKGAVKQSESMTDEQYAKFHQDNPQFPPTLPEYRGQIKARLAELNAMSPEEWQDEMSDKVPPLQRASGPAPFPSGAPADSKYSNPPPALPVNPPDMR